MAASSSAAAPGPAADSRASLNKSELFKAYKSVGPHKMYMDIMGDDQLRAAGEILVHVTRPLHEQYKNDLDGQKNGLEAMLEWSAQRSLASTQATVINIFKMQSSKALFRAMRLPHCYPPLDYDENLVELQDDITLTEKAAKFATHLSSNYAWGEMLHHYTLPLAATSLLAGRAADQQRGLKHLKRMVEAIVHAEDVAETNPSVRPLLRDIAFPDEPLAREIMVLLKRGDYSLESVSTQEARDVMLKFCSGSASTKEILESTFAHLSYCIAASNKNKVISPSLLWFYCTSSPYVKDGGFCQHIPTKSDWLQWISQYGDAKVSEMMKQFNQSFKSSSTTLPVAPDVQIPKSAAGISKSKWRLAGPASHYKSSAAVAFAMHDSKHDFKNCADAWAGVC